MRAVRVGGVGQPATVERRGRPDPVREPAGDQQRGPPAHAVAEHADPRAGHLGAAREEREEPPASRVVISAVTLRAIVISRSRSGGSENTVAASNGRQSPSRW